MSSSEKLISKICEDTYKALDEMLKPMTNADRIRNMTDSELAKFLVKVNSTIQDCMVLDCKCEDGDKDCCDCFLEWLQAEVKGDSE